MNILGISAFYHDSAACLLQGGKLVAAAQEERFTRKRHDPDYPRHSIQYCLKQAKLQDKDIDILAYYEKPFIKFERILDTLIGNSPQSLLLALKALPIWMTEKLWMRKTLQREFQRNIPVIFCKHHEAHAASSFFPSPFEEAATLTIDGVGEWSTTTWGIGKKNNLSLKSEIRYPDSLGLLYSALTQYLGFKVNSAEYKVMGLAPYGEAKYVDLIKENLIEIFDDGSYRLNMDYFSFSHKNSMINSKFEKLFGRPTRKPETELEPFHTDVAKSLQKVTEQVVLGLSRHVYNQTKLPYLCLAGGVALNCVANGRILSEGPYKNIWIQPAAGDAGGAIGAAFLAWHHVQNKPRENHSLDSQEGSFLGPEYDDIDIENELLKTGLKYHRYSTEDLIKTTSKLLAAQNIVGWFQGRMEFGPRALGHRSILGDARNPEMQKKMNLKIKFRESFRPFAPSVLAEDVSQYFELNHLSPYMLITCPVKDKSYLSTHVDRNQPKWMSQWLSQNLGSLPSITHVDGSARVHTVEKKTNPLFYELLSEFKKLTGSSVLINTSFNVRGEPIVCTPSDAIRCFIRTDIDVLSVGNFIVERTGQRELLETYRKKLQTEEHFELD